MKITGSFRIDSKLSKALEKEAKQKKTTKTAIIEMLLRNYFRIFNSF